MVLISVVFVFAGLGGFILHTRYVLIDDDWRPFNWWIKGTRIFSLFNHYAVLPVMTSVLWMYQCTKELKELKNSQNTNANANPQHESAEEVVIEREYVTTADQRSVNIQQQGFSRQKLHWVFYFIPGGVIFLLLGKSKFVAPERTVPPDILCLSSYFDHDCDSIRLDVMVCSSTYDDVIFLSLFLSFPSFFSSHSSIYWPSSDSDLPIHKIVQLRAGGSDRNTGRSLKGVILSVLSNRVMIVLLKTI